jgi:hypothetical protein
MKYKLIIDDELTLEELETQVENGAKFKIFPYCISLFFAVTLKRLSPAIFINSSEIEQRYKRKYNRLSYIFGLWGIPWGIHYTINYTRLNKKGGIDVTKDIMLNIDSESLKNRMIELKTSSMVFAHPESDITNTFEKVFKKMRIKDSVLEKVIVGRFLNVSSSEDYHYFVGIKLQSDNENKIEEFMNYIEFVKKELYREFSKRLTFEVIDLEGTNEYVRILEEQGKEYLKM